jgi:hypothetical protein
MKSSRDQQGSLLIAVLLVCLGLSALTAALAAQIALARFGLQAEIRGSALQGRAEEGLAVAMTSIDTAWEPRSIEIADDLSVSLERVDGGDGRLMRVVSSAESKDSSHTISAIVERGSDGLDLPCRAATCLELIFSPGRSRPLIALAYPPTGGVGAGTIVPPGLDRTRGPYDPARVTVAQGEIASILGAGLIDEGVSLEQGPSWDLDPLLPLPDGRDGAAPGLLVVPVGKDIGSLLGATQTGLGLSPEQPVVLFSPGPGPLDARDCGDLYAVLLSGAGGVLLDGSILHGAAMTEGVLDLGGEGQILFDSHMLEWARHACIVRTRLMPGTREDVISGPTDPAG